MSDKNKYIVDLYQIKEVKQIKTNR